MTPEKIKAAATRMAGHIRRTDLLHAPALDALAGRRIYVKAECQQVTGSFKARGAWSAISNLPVGTKGVLAMSSGNHAQGIAWAAKAHGLPAVIVMPSDAPLIKRENTKALGGEVVLYDRQSEDRDAIAAALAAERGLVLIAPFDNEEVIAGQGTIGLELAEQVQGLALDFPTILVPAGGGGLAAGIATALAGVMPAAIVQTVEPVGYDDMARSIETGTWQVNEAKGGGLCDAILTPSPGKLTLPILLELCGPGLTVTEDEVRKAMKLAHEHLGLTIEPGGAVALAAALFSEDMADEIIVIASGGNVDPALFAEIIGA